MFEFFSKWRREVVTAVTRPVTADFSLISGEMNAVTSVAVVTDIESNQRVRPAITEPSQASLGAESIRFENLVTAVTPVTSLRKRLSSNEFAPAMPVTSVQKETVTAVTEGDLIDSLARLECADVALRIESAWAGTVWLVSNDTARRHVDGPGAIYTAAEAYHIIQLSEQEARHLHKLVKQFDGKIVDWRHQ